MRKIQTIVCVGMVVLGIVSSGCISMEEKQIREGEKLIKILGGADEGAKRKVVKEITKHSDMYAPIFFFLAAKALWEEGKEQDAIFWLEAGRIRLGYDIKRSGDNSVGDVAQLMNMQMPRGLLVSEYKSIERWTKMMELAIAWDEKTGHNYDEKWINQHSAHQMAYALGVQKEKPKIGIPKEEWEGLAKRNREEYRARFEKQIQALDEKKIREALEEYEIWENRVREKEGERISGMPSEREAIAKARKQGIWSILCTNYTDWAYPGEVANIDVNTKMYDVGYIVYSKEFSERFGYPESNVCTLDKRMHVMEIRVETQGVGHNCYLNILVEKGLGLDVPEISYVKGSWRLHFPKQLKTFDELREEDKAYMKKMTEEPLGNTWENYYSRNFYLATMDYKPDKRGGWKGGKLGVMLKEYSKEYYKDYDYFSIDIGCGLLTHNIVKQNNASIWIKEKGKGDYSREALDNPDDFLKFMIPQVLIKKILPIVEETESYNFFSVIQNYRGGGNDHGNNKE